VFGAPYDGGGAQVGGYVLVWVLRYQEGEGVRTRRRSVTVEKMSGGRESNRRIRTRYEGNSARQSLSLCLKEQTTEGKASGKEPKTQRGVVSTGVGEQIRRRI